MRQFRFLMALGLTAVLLNATATATANDGASDSEVIDSFLESLSGLESVEKATLESVNQVVEELRDQAPGDTITEALFELYPKYADAIEASDIGSAISQLRELSGSENPFLAADASFYLARTLMNQDEFEQAIPILEQLTGDLADVTVHNSSAQYFMGVAKAGMLENTAAVDSFVDFLRLYPDAPERLRVSAWRQVHFLKSIREGELGDISHRMDFSRRRLAIRDSAEKTQTEQDRIVSMLDKLIEEAEKKEAQSSCKNCKSKSQQQQQGPQQAQKNPGQSKSNQGSSSANPNGRFVEKSFDNGQQSPWSQLRDRSRDPANTAAKDRLPARYRDIVERYFEEASKSPDTSR